MTNSCDNCTANTPTTTCRHNVDRPDTLLFCCSRHHPVPEPEPPDITLRREHTLALVHGAIETYRFCLDDPILPDKLNGIIIAAMGIYQEVTGKPWPSGRMTIA